MQNPASFYKENINKHNESLKQIKQRLLVSSMIRLLLFLTACAAVYFMWSNTQIVIAIIIVTIALFVFLVSKHSDLQYQRDYLQKLIGLNETEIKVLNRDFYDLPSGEKFKNPLHFYSQDVDLFGRGSFFQYLNRTSLESGAERLANQFTENAIDNIPQKQEAIQELAQKASWRQQFSATAALVKTKTTAASIIDWLTNYKPFVSPVMRYLPVVFSAISILIFVLAYLDLVPSFIVIIWFFLGLGIVGTQAKKVNKLSEEAGKTQSTFEQYYKLLILLENEPFKADLLVKNADFIRSEKTKASAVIKSFSRMLSALDQRTNMMVGAFINGFFLADLRNSYRIEKWIELNGNQVSKWFEVIAFFDAYNSLGNFAFNHQNYVFPEINHDKHVLEVSKASHPLLDPAKAVANDFTIDAHQFFIITGANMAGKSTFLRTVSLQIVMANAGLPVCAASAKYSPIKLITSMRTTDSLTDDESYFFSELKRLKYIVEAIKEDRYFIILDEILKGTNSTDKAIGSRKFINKLVASHSTGIIATHDLSLCEAADELDEVKNYYFDAQIKDGELFFDYTFKKGICQNMNASFLLQKMGIV
tara:strand:- start:171187 stop:172956 length:1770 start_codon:yes stop_codon:yes gene_type:complete